MNTYEKQANEFLQKTNTILNIEFIKKGFHFLDDQSQRNIFKCTLSRGSRSYTFNFGDSLQNTNGKMNCFLNNCIKHSNFKYNDTLQDLIKKNRGAPNNRACTLNELKIIYQVLNNKPSNYDIIACLDIFDGDYQEFCSCFGYDEDSKKTDKIYKSVIEQSNGLKMLFTDAEIEELREIN